MNESIKPRDNFTNIENQNIDNNLQIKNIQVNINQKNNNNSLPNHFTIENQKLKNLEQNNKKASHKFSIIFYLFIGICVSVHSVHFIFSDYVRLLL